MFKNTIGFAATPFLQIILYSRTRIERPAPFDIKCRLSRQVIPAW